MKRVLANVATRCSVPRVSTARDRPTRRHGTRLRGGPGARRRAALAVLGLLLTAWSDPAWAARQEGVRYTVVAASETTKEAADEASAEFRELVGSDLPTSIAFRDRHYLVRVGDFESLEEARRLLARMVELGNREAWIGVLPEGEGPAEGDPERRGPGIRTDRAIAPESRSLSAAELPGSGPEGTLAGGAQEDRGQPPRPAERPPSLEGRVEEATRKQLQARRLADGELTLDGRLDEAAWSTAPFVSDFQKKGARRGFPARDKTEIAVLYDDEALYVGTRVHVPDPNLVRARRSPRDDHADADRVIVSLDTFRNRQTAYNFGVTAGGTRIDYYQPQDAFEVRDYSYDPVWDTRSALTDEGWTAEMRIPFSSLRFNGGGESPVWGINIQRVSPALRLYSFWVVVPGDEAGWSSRFGDLVGLDGVRPAKRLYVVPYVAGESFRSEDQPADDPFADDGEYDLRYGGDFLADLTPNLTLEATVNPDFGQVEADPAVINLSAYEVFFPEKRPFFLEGIQLFEGLGPRYYYSRRIGAPPHRRLNAAFQDAPVDTTILGAAKLIGRNARGRSVGAMVAVTEAEDARTFDAGTGETGRVPVEPGTLFAVSRLQKDFGAGSSIGFVGTGVRRDFGSDGTLETLLPSQAFAGGMDWSLRFAEQSHVFRGFVGASLVEGDSAAILRLQRTSARYLQRPDADYVSLDATRTRLEGYTAGLHLERIEGSWRWLVSGEARSPGFEINDAGAMATADDIDGYARLGWHKAGRLGPWNRVEVAGSVASGWNFGGIRQYTTPALELRVVWRNFWRTYLQVARDTAALSDSLTRGGPLMETPEGWRSRFHLATNDARLWVWSLGGSYSTDVLDGRGYGLNTRVQLRFADRFTVSLGPGYERTRATRQYFTTLAGDRIETFNQRYVFAGLDQRTVYASLRLGLSLTPRLGFDLYLEPFAAVGSYDRFGELLAPSTSDLRLYGTDGTAIERAPDGSYLVTDGEDSFRLADGDFDLTSLRGNAVLRWDYAQGSTLYLVWAQTRDADDVLGGQVRPGDLVEVFDAPARNVFAVKASFRFDLD